MYQPMRPYPIWHIPMCPCQYQIGYRYHQPPIKRNQHGPYMENMTRQTNRLRDYGGKPFVIDIENATEENKVFRRALWTGKHLQVTLMTLYPGEDIGLEVHSKLDQFLRIEEGQGNVQMGPRKNNLNFRRNVKEDDAIIVPAGTWHNITNTGRNPLKLYSIYAPPEHAFGTIHRTKKEAIEAEKEHGNHNQNNHHSNH